MMLDWALTYIGRGWPVIPLHCPVSGGCSCGDASCARVGKHPRTRRGLHANRVRLSALHSIEATIHTGTPAAVQ